MRITEERTNIIEKPKTRVCKKCNRIKPLTKEYWHTNKQQPWNLHIYCKKCRNKARKRYYRKSKIMKRNQE